MTFEEIKMILVNHGFSVEPTISAFGTDIVFTTEHDQYCIIRCNYYDEKFPVFISEHITIVFNYMKIEGAFIILRQNGTIVALIEYRDILKEVLK